MHRPVSPRQLKYLFTGIGALLVLFLLVEGLRAFLVYRAVARITSYGARYAATLEYYDELCASPVVNSLAAERLQQESDLSAVTLVEGDRIREIIVTPSSLVELDLVDGVQDCQIYDPEWRLLPKQVNRLIRITLTDVARYYSTLRVMEYAYDSWIDPQLLHITICSTAPGTHYSSRSHTCEPRQDVGRFNSGDSVVVFASQPYSVGSSIGLSIGEIKIAHERWAIGEQFR
jgi:hypothetical protein